MNRWFAGVAALVASLFLTGASADAQIYYAGPVPLLAPAPIYAAPVYPSYGVVTAAYAYPAPAVFAPAPIVQSVYSAPAYIAPAPVVTTVRSGPFNYVQTTRAYGPGYGPHYSRVHIHQGLFGTTIRERIR